VLTTAGKAECGRSLPSPVGPDSALLRHSASGAKRWFLSTRPRTKRRRSLARPAFRLSFFSTGGDEPRTRGSREQYEQEPGRLHRHDERHVRLGRGGDDCDRIGPAGAREIRGQRVDVREPRQRRGEAAASQDEAEDRRRDARERLGRVGEDRLVEARPDAPADEETGGGEEKRATARSA
jgi:hypothetical protein